MSLSNAPSTVTCLPALKNRLIMLNLAHTAKEQKSDGKSEYKRDVLKSVTTP